MRRVTWNMKESTYSAILAFMLAARAARTRAVREEWGARARLARAAGCNRELASAGAFRLGCDSEAQRGSCIAKCNANVRERLNANSDDLSVLNRCASEDRRCEKGVEVGDAPGVGDTAGDAVGRRLTSPRRARLLLIAVRPLHPRPAPAAASPFPSLHSSHLHMLQVSLLHRLYLPLTLSGVNMSSHLLDNCCLADKS